MAIILITYSIVGILGYVLVTQIITPIINKTTIFPMFNKTSTTNTIRNVIENKESELRDELLLNEVDNLETKIIEKRNRRKKK